MKNNICQLPLKRIYISYHCLSHLSHLIYIYLINLYVENKCFICLFGPNSVLDVSNVTMVRWLGERQRSMAFALEEYTSLVWQADNKPMIPT